MGYQLVPQDLPYEVEITKAPDKVPSVKQLYLEKATRTSYSFDATGLRESQLEPLRSIHGWNEFSSERPHLCCQLVESVRQTLTGNPPEYRNNSAFCIPEVRHGNPLTDRLEPVGA